MGEAAVQDVYFINGSSEKEKQKWYEEEVDDDLKLCYSLNRPKAVFIMGGGEGSAAREALKHRTIERVVMCDIDEVVVDFCRRHLTANSEAFANEKLCLVINDAKAELQKREEKYDMIVGDLADPMEGGPCYQLYTKSFYEKVLKPKLQHHGIFVTQAGPAGVLTHKVVFSSIYNTLRHVFKYVIAYTAHVPSFVDTWGWVMASDQPFELNAQLINERIGERINGELLYLNGESLVSSTIMNKSVHQSSLNLLPSTVCPLCGSLRMKFGCLLLCSSFSLLVFFRPGGLLGFQSLVSVVVGCGADCLGVNGVTLDSAIAFSDSVVVVKKPAPLVTFSDPHKNIGYDGMNGNASENHCCLNLITSHSCEVETADSGDLSDVLPGEDLPGSPSHALVVSDGVVPLELVAREVISVAPFIVESNVSPFVNVLMGNVGYVDISISMMSNTYLKAYLSRPLNNSVLLQVDWLVLDEDLPSCPLGEDDDFADHAYDVKFCSSGEGKRQNIKSKKK
ncbi:Thermospermine synthase ACAULIS5 [Dendrobium catenatum]|uniref:Thermospermine synthase ACAULIS5 n=1 Tax=Dendrobium catenatum TaxID=906689 RepID=A0A2I0WDR8_9ASPA|nr:Thermospermine synthase ACAULIS5 [Dendrobium catenatum]